MTYHDFESLPVWKSAMDLGIRIFALTDDRAFTSAGGLKDRLRRAAVSVSNNIAEGFERGSTAELLAFIYIARGSAGEVRSMLRFLQTWPQTAHLASATMEAVGLAESCSRQIRGWADSLQNSEIKGQRHLNDASKADYQNRKRSETFINSLKARHQEFLEQNLRSGAGETSSSLMSASSHPSPEPG